MHGGGARLLKLPRLLERGKGEAYPSGIFSRHSSYLLPPFMVDIDPQVAEKFVGL